MLETIRQDTSWTFDQQNLLLTEFGFQPLDADYEAPGMESVFATISDSDLIEMCRIVLGDDADLKTLVRMPTNDGNWRPDYIRLFISHSAKHREFVGSLADELAVAGIHAFVAHDTMIYSQPWQAQIEEALQTAQTFVAIVHPEFNDSHWCSQEVGWALGRRIPAYFIRMGSDPIGFPGRDQWPSATNLSSRRVSGLITNWVSELPGIGSVMVQSLLSALRGVGNYIDAGATASRIATLGTLTESQWRDLDEIYWRNDQVRGGALPKKALLPFYQQNGRRWPPEQRTS